MIFSSLIFLFLFLPAVLLLYYLVPRRFRNCILLAASLLFYSWGEPFYILVMIFSTVFDYVNGIAIENFNAKGQGKKAKIVLINSLVINLAVLMLFKYSDFFVQNINSVFSTGFTPPDLSLPIGISFYTFQTMSYSIDVYRKNITAQRNIIDFGTYVAMFPQLVAGPIVKYKDIADQLRGRKESVDFFSYGIKRFITGLFKKVMLANNIGFLWDQISSSSFEDMPMMTAWIGALAFTFQIYFDFSGYSDMAIGLGKMLGFTFLENFNHPYRSKSVTEFWRRWHISLGSWFKEYVYIPLGGSRCGKLKNIRNLLIVWGLTGFWHGASWNFIIWGMFFGIILVIEKTFLLKRLEKIPAILSHLYTMLIVIFSWIIFAFDGMKDIGLYLKAMFGANSASLFNSETTYIFSSNAVLIFTCAIASMGISKIIKNRLSKNWSITNTTYVFPIVQGIALVAMLLVSVSFLIGDAYNPFLYFRF